EDDRDGAVDPLALEEHVVGPGAVVDVALDPLPEAVEVGELGALERADVHVDGAAELLRSRRGSEGEESEREDGEEEETTHAVVDCGAVCSGAVSSGSNKLRSALAPERHARGNYACPPARP